MGAERDPAYLKRLADDVLAFKAAVEHVLEVYVEATGMTGVALGVAPARCHGMA